MKYIKQGFGLTIGAYLACVAIYTLDAVCKKLNEMDEKAEEAKKEESEEPEETKE